MRKIVITKAIDIAKPHPHDYEHVDTILKKFPERWAFGFARRYNTLKNEQGRRAANLYLIEKSESIKQHQIGLAADNDAIIAQSKSLAKKSKQLIADAGDFEQAFLKLSEIIREFGAEPPKALESSTHETLCARFTDYTWWSRKLRNAVGQHVEFEAIKAGFVGFRDAYVSNETLQRRRQQNRRNAQTLEWIEAENDSGYKLTLAELSKKGVSNPENRKNELMTRIRGIEEEAVRKGMTCEFLTITAPSKYHAVTKGRRNPKFQNFTPKDTQKYLVNVWARIRAKLHRLGIQPVGFRVAEPHKDGCPHWHLMLFVQHQEVRALRNVCREYALNEDGHERGAHQHRFTAVSIDPNKGSAAGYIAKYIAKNINMSGLDDFENDETGGSAASGLERSVAWAALWNIRQFQQIGGERITIWRELRRIRNAENLPEVVAVLWKTANAGEYGYFIREACKRKISLIREEFSEKPLYELKMMPDERGKFSNQVASKGELITAIFNKYGEIVTGAVRGVLIDGVEFVTRVHKWFFSYKPRSGLLGLV